MKTLVLALAVSAIANVVMFAVITSRSPSAAATRASADGGILPSGRSSGSPESIVATGASRERSLTEIWTSPTREELPGLIAQMRAAGYPPSVIRSLVSMMVSTLFSERRKALQATAEPPPFWKGGNLPPSLQVSSEARIARRELAREQLALMRELLGPDATDPDGPESAIAERMFGPLSAEKVSQLQQILSDYSDLRQSITGSGLVVGAGRLPEDQEKLALLAKEQDADLRALLSPSEYFEYQVRTGPAASLLRSQLAAFNPTEEEFRAIVRVSLAQSDGPSDGTMGLTGEERMQQNQALAAQLESEGVLTPDRLSEFRIASDPSLQMLTRLTTRFDLPLQAASEVNAIQRDIQQRVAALRSGGGSGAAPTAQQLAALSQEATTRLQSVLGERGLAGYREYGGQWLQALQTPPRATPNR